MKRAHFVPAINPLHMSRFALSVPKMPDTAPEKINLGSSITVSSEVLIILMLNL